MQATQIDRDYMWRALELAQKGLYSTTPNPRVGCVIVRDGIVHLSGVITEERSRQAAVVAAENVAGVNKVHDHLCWVDTMSGMYLNSPEDEGLAKAG